MGFESERFEKMALGSDAVKVETWDVSKSGRKKNNEAVEETGCWVHFSFRGCMPSKSKVDNTTSGTTTSCCDFLLPHFTFSYFVWQYPLRLALIHILWKYLHAFIMCKCVSFVSVI